MQLIVDCDIIGIDFLVAECNGKIKLLFGIGYSSYEERISKMCINNIKSNS